jgi:tetratricopeptide (TPR) repeat protein
MAISKVRVTHAQLVAFDAATALLEKRKYLPASRKFLALLKVVKFAEAYVNLGNCYRGLGREDSAGMAYESSLSVPLLSGNHGMALNNLGLHQYVLGNDVEAIRWYKKCIEADPENLDVYWNQATSVLRMACSGRLDLMGIGWDLYETRFSKTVPTKLHTDVTLPLWSGDKCAVIVLAEQGIGDQFMFGRYLFALREYTGCRVVVQCEASLAFMFNLAGFSTCFKPSDVAASLEGVQVIPICSLARAFWDSPLIRAEWMDGLVSSVREFSSDFYNIGVVWAGSATHANDKHRSVGVGRFNRLNRIEGVKLWSFQGGGYNSLECKNWHDTMAAINGLDLVITVDTSVAHACGAMGKPCWVMMPSQETDFRWGSEGSSNFWYPSVRVFRNPNDWDFVFNNVYEELAG